MINTPPSRYTTPRQHPGTLHSSYVFLDILQQKDEIHYFQIQRVDVSLLLLIFDYRCIILYVA